MIELRTAFADHFWLMYGTLAGFVALVFLVEAWIARHKEKNATELGKVPVVYALPPHAGELGKPLFF